MPIEGLIGERTLIRNPAETRASASEQQSPFGKLNTKASSVDGSSRVSISSKANASGASLDASLEKSNAQIASEAADKITGLREEQLKLAKEADISADPSRRSEIQGQIDNLQSEIERIATDAVDQNGRSVLSDSGATLSNGEVVQRTNISNISDDPEVDVSTEEGAASAVNSITESLGTSRFYRESSSTSLSRAESILQKEVSSVQQIRETDPNKISAPEDAEALAKEVSNSILETFAAKENPAESLTDSLLTEELNSDVLVA